MTDHRSGTGGGDPSYRPSDVSRLQAVVVDASVMGERGDLRLSALRRVSELAARDGHLEVWVTEPVLWEWCEHAAREYRAAASALTGSASRLDKAGVPVAPHLVLSDDQVRDQVADAVRAVPCVRVLELDPQDARDALRDQVLVLGPGKRAAAQGDKRIKTGASDSAWIRSAYRRAGRDSGRYAVLSADGDVRQAYEAWGWPPPLILRNVNDLTSAVEGTAFPTLTQDMVRRAVARVVEEDWLAEAFDVVDEGGIGRLAVTDDDAQARIEVGRVVGAAALGHLKVVDRVGSIEGQLFLLASVDVTAWLHNQVSERFEPHEMGAVDAVLRTSVLFAPDLRSPHGLEVSFNGRSHAHPNVGQWSAPEDAFEELLEALRSLPGAEALDWTDAEWDEDDFTMTVTVADATGHELVLAIDGDGVYGPWTARVTHAGTAVDVTCTLQDSDYYGQTWGMEFVSDISTSGPATELQGNPWAAAAHLLPGFAIEP